MKTSHAMAGALYLALLVLYYPTLSFQSLALDDRRQLAHAASADWQLLAPDPFGHVRPVKQLLFQIVVSPIGAEAWPVRAAILALLLLCVALVQRHATRLSGSPAFGVAVAACFGLNPTLASVTAWLSSVNVVICAVLVVGYLELGERAAAGDPRGRMAALVGALIALALAGLSYEIALVAPIALALRMWVQRSPAPMPAARALAAGSALCVIAVIALHWTSDSAATAVYRSASTPAWLLAASSARYLFENARLWLSPWNTFGVLLADDPTERLLASLICAVALLGAVAFAYRFRDRDRVLTYGLAFFALFLLPLCNLIPLGNTPVAMHYLCLPSIGLALALCRAAARVLSRTPPAVPLAVFAALCIAFAAAARPAIAAFGSESALYGRTLEHYPDNVEVLVNLASLELSQQHGDADTVAALLDRAERIAPHDPGVVRNRFVLLTRTRRFQQALAMLDAQPALDRDPGMLTGRGEVLLELGRAGEAEASFERAYQLALPRSEERLSAGYQLLVLELSQRGLDRARPLLSSLLSEYPDREELAPARALLAAPPP